jgi:hypothetical protein
MSIPTSTETSMLRIPIAHSIAASSALVACLAVAGCDGAAGEPDPALATTSEALSSNSDGDVPPLPSPTLAVPAGNRLAFFFDATGVQIYACQTNGAWTFQAPEATLYGRKGKVEGSHYAGPTWESKDGSQVVGSKLAGFAPDPTAIPWLLLKAISHAGDGRMEDVTYVQRLETVGGLAPTTGCDADHPGAVARVDYSATYYFYRAQD